MATGDARGWGALLVIPPALLVALVAGPVVGAVTALLAVHALVLSDRASAIGSAVRGLVVHRVRDESSGTRHDAVRVTRATGRFVVNVVPAALGCLALLVALDWAAGAAWQRATGNPADVPVARDLAGAELPASTDTRADTDALADEPWADRYFAEFERLDLTYVPFIGPREQPVRGRHINSRDGVRASYKPPGVDGDDAVDVWFFGGSTMWGEGQRDGHTIPSEVARLAEDEGVIMRAVNFGERGYTAFQEFLLFEQELARREPPDLAVFYHGVNEEYSLLEAPENLGSQPSIFQLGVTADAFDRAPPLPGRQSSATPSVSRTYRETSAVHKLLRGIGDTVAPPAGAQGLTYLPTPAEIDRARVEAVQIYRRSVALIRHVADRHDVPELVFWQPAGAPADSSVYFDLGEAFTDEHIDISDALDHPPAPIFIDGPHTNELGARMSARAIWEHLAPALSGGSLG